MSSVCPLTCSNKEYKVVEVIEKPITWHTPWVSEVFIYFKSEKYEKKTEYYTYDKEDLVSDIGGFLGMLLGWSFVTILTNLLQYSRKGFLCFKGTFLKGPSKQKA